MIFHCMNDYNLFTHSSITGHLGCSHLLTVVNNASVNEGAQTSGRGPAFTSFGCIYSEAVLLVHLVIPCLVFLGTAVLFSIAAVESEWSQR